jgi:hypothetical protein
MAMLRRTVITALAATAAGGAAGAASPYPRLVFLNGMRVVTTDAEGKDLRVLSEARPPAGATRGSGLYDGVAYDPRARQVYWTDMGRANADDGTVQRVSADGGAAAMLVPPGGAFTPKQMKLDLAGGHMYWSDREGMRIMRSRLDGSAIEVLVQTGAGEADRKDQARWCVGIALDIPRRQVYWTQKGGDDAGQGLIRRAPIDLDLDLKTRRLYWTDRGDNTVSRAPMDPPKGYDPAKRPDRQILVRGLGEAIGIALDLPRNRMFYTSLAGEVGTAALDGSGARLLIKDLRPLTGIALMER